MSQTREPISTRRQTTTQTSQDLSLPGTLRLRGEDAPNVTPEPSGSRRIRWSEDVVDNEGMGKKSSKEITLTPSQCAVSTTKLDLWARVAPNPSLPPALPIQTVKVRPTVAEIGQIITTRTPEDGTQQGRVHQNSHETRLQMLAHSINIAIANPSPRGNQAQMHMKRCPEHRRVHPEEHDLVTPRRSKPIMGSLKHRLFVPVVKDRMCAITHDIIEANIKPALTRTA
ncbi:hypothetical protein N7486_009540 [Penicillium sp. IBT 16267x]|nr:hypothetical protein N7486_009540 [Penicillium sp. IBT 16267x]